MEILKYILIGIYILVCLVLIVLAMVQSKEDAGASGAIVGGSSDSFYEKNKGKTKEGMLKKWTIILGIAFAILTVTLGILYVI